MHQGNNDRNSLIKVTNVLQQLCQMLRLLVTHANARKAVEILFGERRMERQVSATDRARSDLI